MQGLILFALKLNVRELCTYLSSL